MLRTVAGAVAIALALAAYVPYIRDILQNKTKPHVYSWALWAVVTAIAFALQFAGGAGIGSWVTLTAAILCTVVFFFGLATKGKRDIKLVDTLFLVMALIALVVWLGAKQPVLSTVLVTLIDVLGFAPTVRKSWDKPYSETLIFYQLNALRFVLAVIALRQYTVVTAMYPVAWASINLLFALLLIVRRSQVKPPAVMLSAS